MKKYNHQFIGNIIKKILKDQNLDLRLRELDVIDYIRELLGKNIMKYISNISYSDGKLIIKTKSSAVRSELSFQKSEIMNSINENYSSMTVSEIILK
tara:strand:- start:379 stop:669 length:291 start_codon:yes stop_codon:yes gene_type:complete